MSCYMVGLPARPRCRWRGTLSSRDAAPLPSGFFEEFDMRPVKRYGVSKGKSAKQFRRNSRRTKSANMTGPMRGGIRL